MNEITHAALSYAARGWPVFPLHSIDDSGRCTCRKPCSSPGKHPRTLNGLSGATTEAAQVERWWRMWPEANVGIVTGEGSNIAVVDVDTAKGGSVESLLFGGLDESVFGTTTARTGGGLHLFYKFPENFDLRNSASRLADHIDIRGAGGYVVGAPSRHVTGTIYEWLNETTELREFPQVWLEKLTRAEISAAPKRAESIGSVIGNGSRNTTLASIAGSMQRRGMSDAAILAGLLVENDEKCQPPMPRSDVEAIAKSISRYPKGEAEEKLSTQKTQKTQPTDEDEDTPGEYKTFPKPSDDCFFGLGGDFVRLVEPHSEADPMALLLQFLTYAGNIAGRGAYYQVEGVRHHTNLYALIIGNTAVGRKGTAFGRVREALSAVDEDHDREGLISGIASGEGLQWAIRDGQGEDPGVTDKRKLVVESEWANVIKKQNQKDNTIGTAIRRLWDWGSIANLTKHSPIKVTDAHVSIIGHITAQEFTALMDDTDAFSGTLNRFLLCSSRRSKLLPFGSEVPASEFQQLKNRIATAMQHAKSTGQRVFWGEDGVKERWEDAYVRLETSRTGFVAKVTDRASPQVIRLALIFTLLDGKTEIGNPHLKAALAVWDYCEQSARFIFGGRSTNSDAEKIKNALMAAPSGLDRTALRELFSKHITKARLDAALQSLLDDGTARFERVENTGGKPKEVWFFREPCVISVQSVESRSQGTFNALDANNAAHTKAQPGVGCPDCGGDMVSFPDSGTRLCGECKYTEAAI